MENNLMFAYYLMLSNHMWDDENTPARYQYLPQSYTPEIKFSETVWDKTIDFLAEKKFTAVLIDVGDGVKLDSHPEIAAPNAWSREKLQEKLAVIRAKGMEPLPKLNFSACHHTWLKEYRRMLSTPKYYEVCADVIREVCEIFGSPRLFHLGLDEENFPNQKFREMVLIRGEKLWWHDAYFFFEQCEKNGARPWVWSDYLWDHPDLFVKYMPKEVLQSNWFYNYFQHYDANTYYWYGMTGYEKLNALGYDQVPTCSTWSNGKNTLQTLYHGKNVIAPEYLKGYMTASWFDTTDDNEYALYNDAFRMWNARREVYPETLA